MLSVEKVYETFLSHDVDFFTGVPDSLLKNICAYITDHTSREKHIIAANEGAAVGIASGYYMASGKVPVVYMQNSGLGNTVNPLLSLADEQVYSFPMLLMIGWRGEPGTKDEPQHKKQGEVTLDLLKAMRALPYGVEGFATPKHLVKEDGSQAQMDEKLEFKVIEFNKDAKRIILSHSRIFEDVAKAEERAEKKAASNAKKSSKREETPAIQNQAASTTLGDIDALAALKEQLEGKK